MLPKFRPHIIQTLLINVCGYHFASKLMQMPKFRHKLHNRCIHLGRAYFCAHCVHPSIAWLPKFRQALLKISSN